MIVYMYYGLLPEIKLSYLILSYLINDDDEFRWTSYNKCNSFVQH